MEEALYDRRCTLFLISSLPLSEALDSSEVADISRTRSRVSQLRRVLKLPQAALAISVIVERE